MNKSALYLHGPENNAAAGLGKQSGLSPPLLNTRPQLHRLSADSLFSAYNNQNRCPAKKFQGILPISTKLN
jgi:hypothetical protein